MSPLRIRAGFPFTKEITFEDAPACGVLGEPDYIPETLADLSGSVVTWKAKWPGGELETAPLTLSIVNNSLGVPVLSKVTLTLSQVQVDTLPQGYDFPSEFIRLVAGIRYPLGEPTQVRIEGPFT